MRLSWDEVRFRAAKFADEWRGAAYEKGETQSFYNDFFEIFGVERRSVARYEEHVKRMGAVSPAPRLTLKMAPVRIPGSAWGRATPRITCHRVAPSA